MLVEQGLPDLDALQAVCTLVDRIRLSDDLAASIEHHQPDLLVLDVRVPTPLFLDNLKAIQEQHPLPVVIFTQDDTQESIKLAVEAGVAAYIVDSMQCERLGPILSTALARFQRWQGLQSELSEARLELENRKLVERAKGIIMRQRNMTEDQAFHFLRRAAMDSNQSLTEVANRILAAADLFLG